MKKIIFAITLLFFISFSYFRHTEAAKPSDFGLKEGDVISAAGFGDPDVYIINDYGYKRLFVNPEIFNLYGHLGWSKIKKISPETRDAFITSGLFRNCETGDVKVYGLEVVNEDVANLRWVNTTGAQAVSDDPDFFKKVFCINTKETKLYGTGSQYSSVRDIPKYVRSGSSTQTPAPTSTTLRIDIVAPNKILAGYPYTLTIKGTGFNKSAKVDFGSGNIELGYAITSDTQINVLVPSGMPSLTYNLSITNPDGQIAILKDALTVQGAPPPVKNGLTPDEISNLISPSIVQVGCGIGSGFVFENGGYILTNEHVVNGCSSVEVKLKDDTILHGQVLGTDVVNDVAVIKVNKSLPVLTLGNSDQATLLLGSKVFVFGHPIGLPGVVMTQGLLTSRQRLFGLGFDYLTTDAATEGGSSGGAWVDEKGEVVGLHVSVLLNPDKTKSSVKLGIPINFVKTLLPALKAGTSTPPPSSLPTPTPTQTSAPTPIPTPIVPGTLTVTQSPTSPAKAATYWGQTNTPFSAFRFTSTNEGFFIEKLTVNTSDEIEAINAKANVKKVRLTYKNKAGTTLTSEQSFTNGASANFGFVGDNRPYVPKDSHLDISVATDLRTRAEGATSGGHLSLDFSDAYDGSANNGFKAVGENSGTVLNGASSGIDDITGKNDIYIYRVFPKFDSVNLSGPYALIGTPDVLKFSVTAMGLSDSKLLFGSSSGLIKFEVTASGNYIGNTAASSSFTVYDESNLVIDTAIATGDVHPSPHASLIVDFGTTGTGVDVEIIGGQTKTFRVQFTNPSNKYTRPLNSNAGIGADYFSLSLQDSENDLINWLDNPDFSSSITRSVFGTLRNFPLFGPTFTR